MNNLSRDLLLIAHPFTGPKLSEADRITLIKAAEELENLYKETKGEKNVESC